MRIPSGVVDQVIYFVAVDSTDLATRETGLTSFTVYRDRNGGGAAAMTTPTVTEVDATNMPGVYKLLCDEDMTIASGNDSEEMVYHITQASMAPVTRTIEIYRRSVTAGNTLGVASDGDISGNVDGTVATVTNLTNVPSIPAGWLTAAGIAAGALDGKGNWNIGKTGYTLTQTFPANFSDLAVTVTTGKVTAENVTLAATTHTGAVIPTVSTLSGHTPQTADHTAAIAAIQSDTNDLQTQIGTAGAGLTDLGGMSTAMKAQVNAEALDVLATDTHIELASVPPATSSIKDKITWLFMLARNKIEQTSTTTTLRADDTTTSVATSTVSDDGTTATRGEMT